MSERTLIAVVDDEPAWVAALGRAIVREGYHAQLIGDADAALDLVAKERPQVVLIDRHMPRLDGLCLAGLLQDELREKCPPLVLVTGDLYELGDEQLARFDAVYEKPVSLAKLMRTVRRLVRGQKSSGAIPKVSESVVPPSSSQAG